MQSVFRSTVRATTRRVVTAQPLAIANATRSISVAARINQRIAENSIPVSTYIDDGTSTPDRKVIAVDQTASSAAAAQEVETVIPLEPLTKAVYETMNPTMKKFTLQGKTVLVTGGARGLGNNMAKACIEAGAKAIVIFDARKELGDEAAAELHEQSGIPIQFYQVDVRDENAIQQAMDSVVEQFGAPDVLINSAGIADSNIKAEDYDVGMFRRLIDINLNGSFLMCQSVGKAALAAGKSASIVLIASMSGSIVNFPQEQSAYNASKAGVIHLGKSLAAEWAKHGIRVNSISPGYMDTALNRVPALDAQKAIWIRRTPQQRLGAVDDLNGLAVFLASDASGFMTGSDVLIDGGYTLW